MSDEPRITKLPSGTPTERVTKGKIQKAIALEQELSLATQIEQGLIGEAERQRLENMGLMIDPYTLRAMRVLEKVGDEALATGDPQSAALYLKYTLPMPEQKHTIKADVSTAEKIVFVSHGIAAPPDNDSDEQDAIAPI